METVIGALMVMEVVSIVPSRFLVPVDLSVRTRPALTWWVTG